ncbi:YbjN domain-containing protein [Flexivirga sp. ID2601S]|uniref:YbjN domain-containing protein n=1 Tax=Flexivirga aerilata TaxID=1656889 RepID=A0A849ABH5_9MICO|nr:YbjN domain-containing protein [Flexivirga aerilata]NNG37839.1 YbjN domain-containing protein [Flexivirga aerilata]
MTRTTDIVERYLTDTDVEWELGARDGEFVVSLPGERKLKTVVSLVAGETALTATAFVIRHPDENHAEFAQFLLRRNLRRPGVAYATDEHGDVYVVARVPVAAVDDDYLDTLLGTVLEASDEVFNDLLVLGFRSSMQREWDWRISRGESTRNLEAFRHLLDRGDGGEARS